MSESNGPEFEVQRGEDPIEIISESEAQQVYNTALAWAEWADGSVGDLDPATRPGFYIRVTQGDVRLGPDRASVRRSQVHERGEEIKMFPLGQPVYAYSDQVTTDWPTERITVPETEIMAETVPWGMEYQERVQRDYLQRSGSKGDFDNDDGLFNTHKPETRYDLHDEAEAVVAQEVIRPTGDDSTLTVLMNNDPPYPDRMEVFVSFIYPNERTSTGEPASGTFSNINVRGYNENPRMLSEGGGGPGQIFFNMDLPTTSLVVVEFVGYLEQAMGGYTMRVK